jgi:PrgI family protein
MQFQVPQFLEVEARIFGPLTIKQFVYLAGGAGFIFVMYTTTKNLFYTFIFSAPVIALALVLAFKRVNNKPFSYILEAAVKYFFSHKLYLWKKSDKPIEKGEDASLDLPYIGSSIPTTGNSKLKEIAWQLNTSTGSEIAKVGGYTPAHANSNTTKSFIHEEKMVKAYSKLGNNISRLSIK